MQKAVRKSTEYYAKNLSRARVGNLAKLWSGYHYSRSIGSVHQWGMPAAISVEPTTACNLGCPECPSGLKQFTRPTGNLKSSLVTNLLDEIGTTLQYLTFYFQGEPFIHPGLLDMVNEAQGHGVFTATSTNAHFITEKVAEDIVKSGLGKLIISIDGTSQEIYEQYRRFGKLEKVIEGTRNVLSARKRLHSIFPLVVFQFLVVKPNEHQIGEVKALADDLGVDDLVFKTAQVYDFENGNPLIPSIDRYSRYRQKPNGKWEIKNKLLNQCWKMWHSCVMTWDGRIVPCCFDKDAHYQVGNFGETSFREIWRSDAYNQFRQSILKSRSEIDICRNCSEGTKVFGN